MRALIFTSCFLLLCTICEIQATCLYYTSMGKLVEVYSNDGCDERCRQALKGRGKCKHGNCICEDQFFVRDCAYYTYTGEVEEVHSTRQCRDRCIKDNRVDGRCVRKNCMCDTDFFGRKVYFGRL